MRTYYFYTQNMLRFTPEYLAKMKKNVLSLKLEEQAEFVDVVTYERVHAGIALVSASDAKNLSNWNTTSVGNMAYIALYHPIPQQREIAKYILSQLAKV